MMYTCSYKVSLKGHLLCKIHFYMVFKHKCVLAVCEKNYPRMIKIRPVVSINNFQHFQMVIIN